MIETTPEEHDRQMAATLALTHFIGRSLAEYGAEPLDIDTEGYKRLLFTLEMVTHDTWELFTDMHRYNPFAKDMRDRFIRAAERVDARLRGENPSTRRSSKLNYSAESILVTGGGGFLGGAIVRMMLEEGARVSSFSREFYPDLEALGVKQIQGDLRDRNAVFIAFKGIDVVFHMAAKAGGWGKYRDYFDINVKGTENVIAGCRRHQVSRLIYTSSPSVVFDRRDKAGIDESAPYALKIPNPLSGHKGPGRTDGAKSQPGRIGDHLP